MPISHIKTPKKVSDMKSKPDKAALSSGKSANRPQKPPMQGKDQAGSNSKYLNAKKETKYMAISLSNENLHEPSGDLPAGGVDPNLDMINLNLKYQTQISKDARSDMRDMLYENPYRDSSEHEREDQEKIEEEQELDAIDMAQSAKTGQKAAQADPLANKTPTDNNFATVRLTEEPAGAGRLEAGHEVPADLFFIGGGAGNQDDADQRLPVFAPGPEGRQGFGSKS